MNAFFLLYYSHFTEEEVGVSSHPSPSRAKSKVSPRFFGALTSDLSSGLRFFLDPAHDCQTISYSLISILSQQLPISKLTSFVIG